MILDIYIILWNTFIVALFSQQWNMCCVCLKQMVWYVENNNILVLASLLKIIQ